MIAISCITVIVLILVGYFGWRWHLLAKIPRPRSDVPIEYKIGWWPHQHVINLNGLETRIIFDRLTLLNSTSVVEYRLTGKLTYREQQRPYIKSVHISERWERVDMEQGNVAAITVTPVVAIREDKSYSGEPVEFDLAVQDYLQSGGWGENHYQVSSFGRHAEIVLWQRK